MISIINEHSDELAALARRYGVARLEVFGSAATGEFDPTRSDLDFLVEFVDQPPGGMMDAYFGLLEALKSLFDREVDLVTDRSIKNPYLRKSVDESRRVIYVA